MEGHSYLISESSICPMEAIRGIEGMLRASVSTRKKQHSTNVCLMCKYKFLQETEGW